MNRIRFAALLAVLVLITVAGPGFGASKFVPGEVLVKFKNSNATEKANLRAMMHAHLKRNFKHVTTEVLTLDPGVTVDQEISKWRGHSKIEFIEPNYEVHALTTPNDPLFPQMWGLQNTGQTGGTPGADIHAPGAWNVYTGDPNILIGVIDTGVDYNHPDLAANIWTNPGEIPGNNIDDDGNGYVDDVHGYNFAYGNGDPYDDHGHGTHTSGTIAAIGNNGIGVTGVNWHAKIVAIKFLNSGGSGTIAGAIAAVDYAITVGVRLTSNSWGGGEYTQALLDAINAAGAAGQLFVAAAGNASSDNDAFPAYPASYDSPYIVSVAASDPFDQLAYFSNYGATTVDLAAPGTDILSTFPGGNYVTLSGTSMATPHVAGILALEMGLRPALTNLQAKMALLASVDVKPAFVGKMVTGGRANAFLAVAIPDSIPPGAITDLAATNPTSNTMTLNWTAPGDDGYTGKASGYDIRYSTAPITEGNFASATPVAGPDPQPSGSAETMEVPGLTFSTHYYFAIKASDEFANAGPISNVPSNTTLGAPDITASPASFHSALFTGGTDHQTLHLRNDGAGTLDFSIADPEPLSAAQKVYPYVAVAKGTNDMRTGTPIGLGSGGPDGFGYRWTDSEEPGGPTFDWKDITVTGTPLVGLSGDEDVLAGVPIGFAFPFYGNRFTTVNVGVNGWLSFTSTVQPTYANQQLPNSGVLVPENLIAPFWADLNFQGFERAYVFRDPNHFIITYLNVPHSYFGGSYTFQVILNRNGEIRYQYLDMEGPVYYSTVGIQNDTKTVGLNVAFNNGYVHNGLAVSLVPPPHWVNAAPRSGRIYAGNSQDIAIDFDAFALYGGTYRANLHVTSNDPDESDTVIPLQLDVTGVPDIALSQTSFDFGPVFVLGSRTDTLVVTNDGTDSLRTHIVSSNPVFQASATDLVVPPAGVTPVLLTFTPTATVGYSGTFTITSNDPDEGTLLVNVTGAGVPPPDIGVSPESLSVALVSGESTSRTLHVTNTGASDLTVDVLIGGPLAGSAHVSAAVSRGPKSARGVVQPLAAGSRRTPGDNPGGGGVTPGGPTLNVTHPSTPHTLAGTYAGTYLQFGITDLGEIMPFQYPIGNEHLQVGTYLSGYTVGYYRSSVQQVYFTGYAETFGITPVSYQEIVNTPSQVVVEVVTQTVDGAVRITRQFSFTRSSKAVQIRTTLKNMAGDVLTGLVFKAWADWDMDGDFTDDNWDYDLGRNMVWASDIHFAAIASAETPDLMDIYGWNDYRYYDTYVDYPTGPVFAFDGLEMLHYNRGTLLPGGQDVVTTAYCVGDNLADLDNTVDHAVTNTRWLSATPPSLLIPPGGFADVTVTFDAAGLYGGDYRASVLLHSNDPDESDLAVPASLHVTGAPDIDLSRTSIDFGSRFLGVSHSESLLVANVGTDVLNVTSISSSNPDFTVSASSLTLAPNSASTIMITMTPTVAGLRTGTLTLTSNDPDEPTRAVSLTGVGLIPPVAHVSPDSLAASLFTGQTTTRTLHITNTGGSDLTYDVGVSISSLVATGLGGPGGLANATPTALTAPRTAVPAAAAAVASRTTAVNGRPSEDPKERSGWGESVGRTRAPMIKGKLPPFLASTLPVVIADPVGDAPPGLDVVDLRAASRAGALDVRLDLVPPYNPSNFGGAISLDVDQNRFTGSPPAFGLPGQDIGAEYFAYVFNVGYGEVDVYSQYGMVGAVPCSNDSSGLSFSIPLAMLGYDDGKMDVTGVIGSSFGPTDWFPETGHGTINSVTFLHVSPEAGVVPPGGSQDLTVTFDAGGLFGGEYFANIDIDTNDPGAGGHFTVPAHLHVTGAPDLAFEPPSLDFGSLFVGASNTLVLYVSNHGTDVLSVTHITTTDPAYTVNDSSFTLAPGDSNFVLVTFHPLSVGDHSASLKIASNDPDTPLATVPLHGVGLTPPDISVSPESLSVTLVQGQQTDRTLTISNTGGSDLTFQIPSPLLSATSKANAFLNIPRGQPDPRHSPPVVNGRGGPDGFGYRFVDNTEADGPVFNWIDITPYAPRAPVFGDEDVAIGLPIGFNFPFYGDSLGGPSYFSSVNIAANGWMSFTGYAIPTYFIQPLPNNSPLVPENLVAPFWSDLDLGGAQKIYYYSDGNRFIVSWVNVSHYPAGIGGGPYTFQAILDRSGVITYQYLSMNNPLTGESIGIQNGTKTIGLQVAFNTVYAVSGLAVRISPSPTWLSASPNNGSIPAGASLPINVHFDARDLEPGLHISNLMITSNDPDESVVQVPVRLNVVVQPDIAADSLDFGPVFVGQSRVDSVMVRNDGKLTLDVTLASVTGAGFTIVGGDLPMHLGPGASKGLRMKFTPAGPCAPCTADLSLVSNDPDENPFHVGVRGTGVSPPQIEPSATSVQIALATTLGPDAITGTKTLTVHNGGGSPLHVDLRVGTGATAASAPAAAKRASGEAFAGPAGAGRTAGGRNVVDVDAPPVAGPIAVAAAPGNTIAGSGGPDDFGHTWIDSDDPGGPVYSWWDTLGSRLPLTGDDHVLSSVPLGFSFPFYGQNYTTVNVSTNGWLSFTSSVTPGAANIRLPNTSAPPALLAPYWDNLKFGTTERCYAFHDGNRFVLTYLEVFGVALGYGPLTFQVILTPNGTIKYQYKTLVGPNASCTVGIQNETGIDGLTAVHNIGGLLHDNMAIQFTGGPSWFFASPLTLDLGPGESGDIALNFDAHGLTDGDYLASLHLKSNDLETPMLDIPVTMHVGSIGAVWDVNPNDLNRASEGNWVQGRIDLPTGLDPHDIVTESVRAQGTIPVDPDGPISYAGQEAKYKFDRESLMAQIPDGNSVPVRVSGRVGDVTWFTGLTLVRMLRPKGDPLATRYTTGSHVMLTWTDEAGHPATGYDLWYSANAGESWSIVKSGLTSHSYVWQVPSVPTETGQLELVGVDGAGVMGSWLSQAFQVIAGVTSTENNVPKAFSLANRSGNPVRNAATLELAVPVTAQVSVELYDVRGARVRDLAHREFEPGWHRITWDGTDAAGHRVGAGVFFARMKTGDKTTYLRLVRVP